MSRRLAVILGGLAGADRAAAVFSAHDLLHATFAEGEGLPVRYIASLGRPPQVALEALAVASRPGTQTGALAVHDRGSAAHRPSVPEAGETPADAASGASAPAGGSAPEADGSFGAPTPTLDKFGRDLTRLARMGKLREAVGREKETAQIMVVLARTTKRNPLLLGDAGVGKTAIVEGLAWHIAHRSVPPILRGKRIIEVDVAALTAGTSLRGQFEERFTALVNEASSSPGTVLFIDEIQTIMGGKNGEGGMDGAQILKPALARGDIACIGITTQDEYNRHIRKDPALERRFSPVTISELLPDACLQILEGIATRIVESHGAKGHPLVVEVSAIRAAIELTDRHVKDRNHPDKCIDALDLACARVAVAGRTSVTSADVADVVSEWTGIPARQLTTEEMRGLLDMEKILSARVVGQDEAVRALSTRVRVALSGLKPPNRPVGVFLFLGPSGVGKTQLAKELARLLFGTPEAIHRFDMGEYQQKEKAWSLIGAARGYRDSEQGGLLTEAIRRRRYSVVLLDEIEKAHPDLFDIFLAAFDDGRLTDGRGRVVDCSNVVFVLTSNLGNAERQAGLDGAANAAAPASDEGWEEKQDRLRARAARFLRPELVNRITEIIEFQALGRGQLDAILDILMSEHEGRMADKGITVRLDAAARDLVLSKGFSPKMGARHLERALERLVVVPVAEAYLSGDIGSGPVQVGLREGRICCNQGPGVPA